MLARVAAKRATAKAAKELVRELTSALGACWATIRARATARGIVLLEDREDIETPTPVTAAMEPVEYWRRKKQAANAVVWVAWAGILTVLAGIRACKQGGVAFAPQRVALLAAYAALVDHGACKALSAAQLADGSGAPAHPDAPAPVVVDAAEAALVAALGADLAALAAQEDEELEDYGL